MNGEKKSHKNKIVIGENIKQDDTMCLPISSSTKKTDGICGELKEKKSPATYNCIKCNYFTSYKRDYNKHLTTKKHNLNINNEEANQCPSCKKIYSSASNLWKHKKICNFENIPHTTQTVTPEIFMEVVQNNKDMQVFMMEQQKELQNKLLEQQKEFQNTIIELTKNQMTTINNNSNNTFNLNLFLHEKCKDALNITEFLESLQLTVEDLETTGRLGYVLGISRILINKLKELDVYSRPLHCTDYKRETVYIKDHDKWEKENDDKTKLRNVIRQVEKKNLKMMPVWQEKNPEFRDVATPKNEEFVKISLSSIGEYTHEGIEKQDEKILKNVLKEVIVDKNTLAIQ
jgi:hypothetical protein